MKPRDQMRSCLILGSGRSGTSMLAGLFEGAGYLTGDNYLRPGPSNPLGFFEDREVTRINEDLIFQVVARRRPLLEALTRRRQPAALNRGQAWQARLPVGVEIPASPAIYRRMAKKTSRRPFCFKDPRFSYTLSAWRPYLEDVGFLCVFREPNRTANSMVSFGQRNRTQMIDYESAIEVWTLMYRHIVERHRRVGDWRFVHYDQLLSGAAVPEIEHFTGANLNRHFPSSELRRSPPDGSCPPETMLVYQELCRLAEYSPDPARSL